MFKKLLLTLLFTGFTALKAYDVEAHALSMEVFNPGENKHIPGFFRNYQLQTRGGFN